MQVMHRIRLRPPRPRAKLAASGSHFECIRLIHQGGFMELLVNAPVLELREGQVMTLVDAEGTRIVPRHGAVWVTQEGDRRDHIVTEGEALVVLRGGRTVVQALQSASVEIHEARAAA
jgi:hypothetical protein